MELTIEISGDIVEWQELLNGTQIVTLEGASNDGAWAMSGLVSWNIGLASNAGEGDITLRRDDGAELFGTLVRGAVTEIDDGNGSDASHAVRLEYEIDGGTGAFESADGVAAAEGTLSPGSFRGCWTVVLA
jgi:hypothetical protein